MRRLLMLSLLLTGFSAQAAVVSVQVTGTLTGLDDPDSLLPFGSLVVGATQFTILFDMDLAVPDYIGSDTEIGIYLNAIPQSSMSANGITVYSSGSAGTPVVYNDNQYPNSGDFLDGLIISSGSSANAVGFSLVLLSIASTSPVPPLTSDELAIPFDSPDWQIKILSISIFDEIIDPDVPAVKLASASLSLDSIQVVPIPAAVWLFGSALGLLGWMRRTAA